MSALFNAEFYLRNNPDVAAGVADGRYASAEAHYIARGQFENRDPSPFFSVQQYLAANADVAEAIENGTIASAFAHFVAFGASEERDPSTFFDAAFYLAANPDVAEAIESGEVESAFAHFLQYGLDEVRPTTPFFDAEQYLALNPDVAEAVANGETTAYEHFATFGFAEARAIGNGLDLSVFANDPVAQAAIEAGDFAALTARVAEVAPFVAGYTPPQGYTIPADQPLPTNFVPREGEFLVVPEGVTPPAGGLPPAFEQPTTPPVDTTPPTAVVTDISVTKDNILNIAEAGSEDPLRIYGELKGDLALGDSVVVRVGTTDYTATVIDTGFSVDVPASALFTGTGATAQPVSVTAYVRDAAGNRSTAATADYEVDLLAPAAALLDTVAPSGTQFVFSGRAEAGSTVELVFDEDGDGGIPPFTTTTVEVNDNGEWSFETTKVTGANFEVSTVVIDEAGNRSAASASTVWVGGDGTQRVLHYSDEPGRDGIVTGADFILGGAGDDVVLRGIENPDGEFDAPIVLVGGAGSDVLAGSRFAEADSRSVIMFGGEMSDYLGDGRYAQSADVGGGTLGNAGGVNYNYLASSGVDLTAEGNIFQPFNTGDVVVASTQTDVVAFLTRNDASDPATDFSFFAEKTFVVQNFEAGVDSLVFGRVIGTYVDFNREAELEWEGAGGPSDFENGTLTISVPQSYVEGGYTDPVKITIEFVGLQGLSDDLSLAADFLGANPS